MNFRERIVEASRKVHETLGYVAPRSVGTTRLSEVLSFQREEADHAELDLPIRALFFDNSRHIHQIPRGWFQSGDVAEVIIRRFHGPSFFPDNNARMNMYVGVFCRVAIRPYHHSTFGRDLDPDDPELLRMFRHNLRNPHKSEGFYRRFLPEDFQKYIEAGHWYTR